MRGSNLYCIKVSREENIVYWRQTYFKEVITNKLWGERLEINN